MTRQTVDTSFRWAPIIEKGVTLALGVAIAGALAWHVTAGFRAATATYENSLRVAASGPAR